MVNFEGIDGDIFNTRAHNIRLGFLCVHIVDVIFKSMERIVA